MKTLPLLLLPMAVFTLLLAGFPSRLLAPPHVERVSCPGGVAFGVGSHRHTVTHVYKASHVAGCWIVSGAPYPLTLTRLLDDRDKGDIRGELTRARPAASSLPRASRIARAGSLTLRGLCDPRPPHPRLVKTMSEASSPVFLTLPPRLAGSVPILQLQRPGSGTAR